MAHLRFLALLRVALVAAGLVAISALWSSATAKELSGQTSVDPNKGDWSAADREEFDVQSRVDTTADLKRWLTTTRNTFAPAAIENIRALRSGAYQDVRQRHSLYDFVSFYLEADERSKAGSRDVRFFHATTAVTMQGEIGLTRSIGAEIFLASVPKLARRFGLSRESLATLDAINAELFDKNFRIIHSLVFDWPSPRDPLVPSPTQAIDAMTFDLAMVEFEQRAVDDFIASHAVADATLQDITKMITLSAFDPYGLIHRARPWLVASGFKNPNFTSYAWRVAMGRAMVFTFHKKAEADYVAYMKTHPIKGRRRQALYDAIQSPASIETPSQGAFTIVGSWKTRQGATRQIADLRRHFLGVAPAMFPPYGRDRFWTVAIAAFTSETAARELRRRAVRLKAAPDAFVLRRRSIDPLRKVFRSASTETQFINEPNLLKPAKSTVALDASNRFVFIAKSPIDEQIEEKLRSLTGAHPGLPLAAFRFKDGSKAIALATYANDATVEEALKVARHLNIPTDETSVEAVPLVDSIVRLDGKTTSQSTWGMVKSCFSTGSVTVEAMYRCSGVLLTPAGLTRCIAENDCEGLDRDALRNEAQVETFLKANAIDRETKFLTNVKLLTVPDDANAFGHDVQDCRNVAQAGTTSENQAAFVSCLTSKFDPNVGSKASRCASAAEGRVNEIIGCVAEAANAPDLAMLGKCSNGDRLDVDALTRCLAGADKAAKIRRAEACAQAAGGADSLLMHCGALLLDREQMAKVACVARASGNAREVLTCALPETSQKRAIIKAIDCAEHGTQTPKGAAKCLSGVVGGEGGRIADCVAAGSSRADVVACMIKDRPEIASAAKIYHCVSGGADAASLIANCSQGLIGGDAREVAGCIAKGGGDRAAIAGCAAGALLPKNLGPIAQCAGSSTGGVDFALCMAGPRMNAEWRIAAECAVSSGGEPITFASCTGGRLTIRELTKCLTGKIGTDCFGKGNTIVAAFETVGHDLSSCVDGGACLGKSNEIVRAVDNVSKALHDTGEAAARIWDGAFGTDSDWCRGDLTKWTCHL